MPVNDVPQRYEWPNNSTIRCRSTLRPPSWASWFYILEGKWLLRSLIARWCRGPHSFAILRFTPSESSNIGRVGTGLGRRDDYLCRSPSALLHGCCTRVPREFRTFISSLCFTCKTADFRSGPDETRTRDLCHAKAALSQLSYGPDRHQQS